MNRDYCLSLCLPANVQGILSHHSWQKFFPIMNLKFYFLPLMRYNKRKMVFIFMGKQEEVTMQSRSPRQIEPALAFHLMKFAYQVFEKKVVELTMEEYAEAYLRPTMRRLCMKKFFCLRPPAGL